MGLISDLPSKVKASEEVLRALEGEGSLYIDKFGNIDVEKLPLHLRSKLEQAVKTNPILKMQVSADKK